MVGASADGGREAAASLGPLRLESGEVLPQVRLAYRTWGRLNPQRDNAVLVLHALTGDQRAAGPGGWWEGLIGPGRAVDTRRSFVICPNILGGCSGSTGPASLAPDGLAWGSRFPGLTLRDTVAAEAALADLLGIAGFELVIGGSMGGARAAEWAVSRPERVRRCAVIAANAAATADQLGWCHTQELAIRQDPAFRGGDYYGCGGGPVEGLRLARQIAHLTYRCAPELERRFGRDPEGDSGLYRVESYLEHQGRKLADRFDANSYLTVTRMLAGHDLGRGRGGVEAALARSQCEWILAAVDSDRLFPPEQMERFAEAVPRPAPVSLIRSGSGHDGFLLETDQLAEILTRSPALAPR